MDISNVIAGAAAVGTVLVGIIDWKRAKRADERAGTLQQEANDLQKRLTAIEEQRRTEEVEDRELARQRRKAEDDLAGSANVVPSFGQAEGVLRGTYVLRFANNGQAVARDVEFSILGPVGDGTAPMVGALKAPFDLAPGATHQVSCLRAGGTAPSAEVQVEWTDEHGRRQQVLRIPT